MLKEKDKPKTQEEKAMQKQRREKGEGKKREDHRGGRQPQNNALKGDQDLGFKP